MHNKRNAIQIMLRKQFLPLRRLRAAVVGSAGLSCAAGRESGTVPLEGALAVSVSVTLAHSLPLPQQFHFWEFFPTNVPKCET